MAVSSPKFFINSAKKIFGKKQIAKTINPTEAEAEILCFSDFTSKRCNPPFRMFIEAKKKPLGVQAGKVESFYAGIKL